MQATFLARLLLLSLAHLTVRDIQSIVKATCLARPPSLTMFKAFTLLTDSGVIGVTRPAVTSPGVGELDSAGFAEDLARGYRHIAMLASVLYLYGGSGAWLGWWCQLRCPCILRPF
jgi:hypothetical protein